MGLKDDFFELGGDSILSVQIVARARQAGLVFTVKQIFEHQTVAGLARHAAAMQTPSDVPRTGLDAHSFNHLLSLLSDPGNVEDVYPLSPAQNGMLFHSLMAPESGVYVTQVTCTLPADLDVRLFRQAWDGSSNVTGYYARPSFGTVSTSLCRSSARPSLSPGRIWTGAASRRGSRSAASKICGIATGTYPCP